MSASKQGVFTAAAVRLAAWLSANWAERKAESANPEFTLAVLSTLAPLPAAAQRAKVALGPVRAPIEIEAALRPSILDAVADPRMERAIIAAAPVHVTDFRFAARLAAVSMHNAPSSRAARRPQMVAPARRAIPVIRSPEIKVAKETRLPTAFAVRTLTKKVRPSAVVIDLAAAKNRIRSSAKRAA